MGMSNYWFDEMEKEQSRMEEQCIKEHEAELEKLKQSKKWFNRVLTWLKGIFNSRRFPL